MKIDEFRKLIKGRRFGERKRGQKSGRVLNALRLHLVEGMSVLDAAFKCGRISSAAVYQALGKLGQLPRQRRKVVRPVCPHCHQPMPNNLRRARALPDAPSAH